MTKRKVKNRIIELWGPLAAICLISTLGVVLGAKFAFANGINVQTFSPSSSSSYVLSESGSPEAGPGIGDQDYRRYSLGLSYNYLSAPIVELDSAGATRTGMLVNS